MYDFTTVALTFSTHYCVTKYDLKYQLTEITIRFIFYCLVLYYNISSRNEESVVKQDERFNELAEQFFKINNQLTKIQNKPINIKDDIYISTSQLHLLEMIAKYPKLTITSLANYLGVTKGNISQQIPKLLSLDLVTIVQKKENKKNKAVLITSLGESVLASHNSLHEALYRSITNDLSAFSSDQIGILIDIFQKIALSIDDYQLMFPQKEAKHGNSYKS